MAEDSRYRGGWLCPTSADRVRSTDMSPAVRRARLLAGLFCGVGVLALVPWIGGGPLAVFALVPGPLVVLDRLLGRARRPERVVAASLSLHTTLIVTGVGISGGVHSPLLPWVAIPVVTAAARFRLPVFLTGSVLATTALVLAAMISTRRTPRTASAPQRTRRCYCSATASWHGAASNKHAHSAAAKQPIRSTDSVEVLRAMLVTGRGRVRGGAVRERLLATLEPAALAV